MYSIHGTSDHEAKVNYLLKKINVMERAMYELGPTARESQELTRHLHPVLVPLHLRKLRVWYVVVPYLRENPHTHQNDNSLYCSDNKQKPMSILSEGSDAINQSITILPYLGSWATRWASCTPPEMGPRTWVPPQDNASLGARSVWSFANV